MRWWIAERPMDVLARNADGDELLFLHGGTAELYCDYGHLTISAGDYVMLPRGTMWRVECEAPIALLLIEATNPHYQLPDKGMIGEHAIFDPAKIDHLPLYDALRPHAFIPEAVRVLNNGRASVRDRVGHAVK